MVISRTQIFHKVVWQNVFTVMSMVSSYFFEQMKLTTHYLFMQPFLQLLYYTHQPALACTPS